MDDALLSGWDIKKGHSEIRTVFAQLLDHGICEGVLKRFNTLVCRHDVIDRGKGALWKGDFESQIPKHAEGLRTGDLMDQMGANKKLSRPVGKFFDGMPIPNLMKEGFAHKC